MVLVILVTNVLIRKIRGMMKITQITNKHIKAKEPKTNLSRKSYFPKKTYSHQEDEVSDSETERVPFMAIEDYDKEDT
jgi:hypothetical protein